MLSVPWWFRAAELIVPWGICSPILYIFHLWTNEILVSETKPRTDAFNLVKLLHLRYFSLSQKASMIVPFIVSGDLDPSYQFRLQPCIIYVLYCFVVCLDRLPALEMVVMVTAIITLVTWKSRHAQKMNDIVIQTIQPTIDETEIWNCTEFEIISTNQHTR
jgi:hypothetical protein